MKGVLIWAISLCSFFALTCAAVNADIENKNVERTIDLTSQLVKISYKITIEHKGKKPIQAYSFVVPEDEREHLAYISAKDSLKKEIKVNENKISKGVEFVLAFSNAAATQVVYIETVSTKSLLPHPAKITQSEKQLVRYFGNAYFQTPYKTATQKTILHLASQNVESHTQSPKPVSVSGNTVTYGPYENIEGKVPFLNI